MNRGLRAAEIAVFLGITAIGVRQIVRRHQIAPVGKDGHALLYDPREVIRHAGPRDRRESGGIGQGRVTLNPSGRMP